MEHPRLIRLKYYDFDFDFDFDAGALGFVCFIFGRGGIWRTLRRPPHGHFAMVVSAAAPAAAPAMAAIPVHTGHTMVALQACFYKLCEKI